MELEDRQAGAATIRPESIVGGVVLLIVGGTMLLQIAGWLDVPAGRLIGPLVLIALGALSLIETRTPGLLDRHRRRSFRHRRVYGGLWMLGLGAWMLVSQLHLFGLTFHTSWPLLLVLSGVLLVVRGLR